jgi:hypothetical protein
VWRSRCGATFARKRCDGPQARARRGPSQIYEFVIAAHGHPQVIGQWRVLRLRLVGEGVPCQAFDSDLEPSEKVFFLTGWGRVKSLIGAPLASPDSSRPQGHPAPSPQVLVKYPQKRGSCAELPVDNQIGDWLDSCHYLRAERHNCPAEQLSWSAVIRGCLECRE